MNKQTLTEIHELTSMLDNGVPVKISVGCLANQSKHWKKVQSLLETDKSFFEAMSLVTIPGLSGESRKILLMLIQAGELAGVLDVTLRRYVESELKKGQNDQANFFRFFGLMLSCGVPILTAIDNIPASNDLDKLKVELGKAVRSGNSIAEVIQRSKLFRDYIHVLISAGEQTGSLPEMLLKTSDAIEMSDVINS